MSISGAAGKLQGVGSVSVRLCPSCWMLVFLLPQNKGRSTPGPRTSSNFVIRVAEPSKNKRPLRATPNAA